MRELKIDVIFNGRAVQYSGLTNDGIGPTLICLHGIQGNAKLFEPLLSQSFLSEYNVIALDLLGFGSSFAPTNFSYSLEDQTSALLELVRKLGLSAFHLLGHSLGGMIGALLLGKAPEQILSLINLEGNLTLGDCGDSKNVEGLSFDEFRESFFPKLIERQRTRGLEHLALSMSRLDPQVFYRTAKEIVRVSRSEQLLHVIEASQVPVLFLIGKAGSFVSRPSSPLIQLVEIEGADHFSLSRSPFSFAAIEEFLRARNK